MDMAANRINRKFEHLTYEQQRLIRVGYYDIYERYFDEGEYQKASTKELEGYFLHGQAIEKRNTIRGRVIYGVISLVALLGLGYYLVSTKNAIAKQNAHYASITYVDACEAAADSHRLGLLVDDFYAIAPKDLKAEYNKERYTSSCKFFIRGERGNDYYVAFITAEVTKQLQRPEYKKDVEPGLLADSPYNVFQYQNGKDFYYINVKVGIDPKDTTYDAELRDAVSKLILLVVATGVEDKLPSNPDVTNYSN